MMFNCEVARVQKRRVCFLKKKEKRLVLIQRRVVPRVEDVSLVDGFLEGAFGGDGDDYFGMGHGVCMSSSSWVKSTKSFLDGMIVIFSFFEGLEEEA
ncbi:hypothetical protein Tco_1186164 [Tanacetum coccineum]